MPRATRRSLAGEDTAASARSRSRTPAAKSPKAADTSTASPRSARGKGKVEAKAAESKRAGRSTSRGKAASAAAEASPAATAARTSKSRSQSAASRGKKTPTAPAKRGREKATDEEEAMPKSKRARSRGQSAGKSPQRRGRSPAKAAAPSKSKAKTPAKAAAASTSRTAKSKSPAARKAKSPAAAAPAKGKGKSPAKVAASTKRQSKSPVKTPSRSPRTPAAKTANRKKDAKKSTPRNQTKATPPSRGSRTPTAKAEKKKAEAKKPSPRGRGGTATPSTPKACSQEPVEAEEEEERNMEEEMETTEEPEKNVDEDVTKKGEDDAIMEEDKDDTKDDSTDKNSADEKIEEKEASEPKDVSTSVTDSAKKEEEEKGEVSENKDSLTAENTAIPAEAPVANASEKKLEPSAAETTKEPAEKDENGEVENIVPSPPPRSGAVKRKFEEVTEETEDDKPSAKQARVNGEEKGEVVDSMKGSEASGAAAVETEAGMEEDLLRDYVVVSKEEVPAAGSAEVAAAVPAEHEEPIPEPLETTEKKEAGPSGSKPVFLVPLTQVEMIKACAYGDKNEAERGDMEDASSVAVEVGSLASSEISSRQLDILDTLSAANSIDGDRAASEGCQEDSMEDTDKLSAAPAPTKEPEPPVPSTAEPSIITEVQADASSTSEPVESRCTVVVTAAPISPDPPSPVCADPVVAAAGTADRPVSNSNLAAQAESQSDPATVCPSGPATVKPSDPPTISPSDPARPSDPPTISPSDPATVRPSDPATICPSDPATVNPTDPATVNPTDPATVSPSDPAAGHVQPPNSSINPQHPAPSVETPMDSVPSPMVQNAAGPPPPAATITTTTTESPAATAGPDAPNPAVLLPSFSSSGIFSRAYVPNPEFPPVRVTPDRCFSVVSYNILAECNRRKADYSYTGEEFLVQEYRHSLLMKELKHLDGDLVCLQEVNPEYFDTTLLPAMKSLGYDGLIMRRTKDVYDEGEATFYKTSLFELESSKGLSLSTLAFKEVEQAGVSEEVGASLRKYLDRADVVLITRLHHKASGRSVTIGNVHVVWDFSLCPDVQCIQIACAIKEVSSMSGNGGTHMVCGDFNSECTSPAYQMVLDGSLSQPSVTALQAINNLDLENGAKSLVSHLGQAFQHTSTPLKSAYYTVTKSEPEITSLTSFMEGAVDYQFYSADTLAPVGVLKTVDKAVVKVTGGLPTRDFPSDHLSMKSVMTFC